MNKGFRFVVIFLVFCTLAEMFGLHAAETKRPHLLMIDKRGRYMEVEYLEELNAHGFDIKGLSRDEMHVKAADQVAELTIKEAAFDTNAQPIVVHDVNAKKPLF